MKMNRMQMFLAVAVAGAGLFVAALLGMWAFMSATPPLHRAASAVPSVSEADPPAEWARAVEQAREIVRASLAGQNLPGVSFAVGVDGQHVWAEGFGFADLENRVPVSPRTRFRIGTASIALTSAAVGLLLEQDQLKLDDTIQTYVPEYPDKQWPVTLGLLMSHRAGVRNDSGDEGPLFGRHCERPVDALEEFKDDALRFEPGTQFRYSSYGWILMSAAVEDAANEPFLTYMRRKVFEPLGMEDTKAESATESIPNRATFYFPRFSADPKYGPDVMRDLDYSCYAGASVFLSTPTDLVRFAQAVTSGKLLQPATVKLLQTGQRLATGEETGYGLGWDLETATVSGKPTLVVGHDGDSLGGRVASLMTFPELGIVVSVISNTSYADTFAIGVKVAEAFSKGPTEAVR